MKTYQSPDFQITVVPFSDVLTVSGFYTEKEGIGETVDIDSLFRQ